MHIMKVNTPAFTMLMKTLHVSLKNVNCLAGTHISDCSIKAFSTCLNTFLLQENSLTFNLPLTLFQPHTFYELRNL